MQQISYDECVTVSGGVGPKSLYTALCMIPTGILFTALGCLGFTKLGRGDERHQLIQHFYDHTEYYHDRTVVVERIEDAGCVFANAPTLFKHSPLFAAALLWWGIGMVCGGFAALSGVN